jgi:hypothetical protein
LIHINPAARGAWLSAVMDERSEYLRREIDTYRRFLDEGVDPELAKVLIERVAIAELELQILALTAPQPPKTLH